MALLFLNPFVLLPATGAFPVSLILNLKDLECTVLSFGSSLQFFHKLPYVSD